MFRYWPYWLLVRFAVMAYELKLPSAVNTSAYFCPMRLVPAPWTAPVELRAPVLT